MEEGIFFIFKWKKFLLIISFFFRWEQREESGEDWVELRSVAKAFVDFAIF